MLYVHYEIRIEPFGGLFLNVVLAFSKNSILRLVMICGKMITRGLQGVIMKKNTWD